PLRLVGGVAGLAGPTDPVKKGRGAVYTRMTRVVARHSADVPLLPVVDGKEVIPGHYNVLQRFVRFLLEPFTGAWRNRDLIAAILRRELRERFSGSVAGWGLALVAPLISLITYTLVFGGAVKLPNRTPAHSPLGSALL